MARNEITYTVRMEGRDFGKQFVIVEMGARPAWEWAVRVVAAMINGGAEIPVNLHRAGLASLAIAGLAGMRYLRGEDVIEFGNELMACIQIKTESGQLRKATFEGDIEELATFGLLQKAAFDLHKDPFIIGVRSILGSTPEAAATVD